VVIQKGYVPFSVIEFSGKDFTFFLSRNLRVPSVVFPPKLGMDALIMMLASFGVMTMFSIFKAVGIDIFVGSYSALLAQWVVRYEFRALAGVCRV
jgi:hypothetical protein